MMDEETKKLVYSIIGTLAVPLALIVLGAKLGYEAYKEYKKHSK